MSAIPEARSAARIEKVQPGCRWEEGVEMCCMKGLGSRPVPMPKSCPGVPAPGQDLAVAVNGHGASAAAHLQGSAPLAP